MDDPKQQKITNLSTPQLLVATCQLNDSEFAKSIVLLHQHDDKGSKGVVVNHPLEAELSDIFDQLDIDSQIANINEQKIYLGGPVERNHGHILTCDQDLQETVGVFGHKKCLQDIAQGKGPKDFIVAVGHAAWRAGQLERELAEGLWFQRPVDLSLIFQVPTEYQWEQAAHQVGFDMRNMAHFVGHD